jgi:hypothetical protein
MTEAEVKGYSVTTVDHLYEVLKQLKDKGKGEMQVVVQEYGRTDVPQALTNTQYACVLKVKVADGHPCLFEKASKNDKNSKDVLLIAYV